MKVLLTSAGLEAEAVQEYFMSLLNKDAALVKALFIPTAAIDADAIAVSAGSIIFANNLQGNLGLINTKLDVHCAEGESAGKVGYPIKGNIKLTNATALAIRDFPNGIEVIG